MPLRIQSIILRGGGTGTVKSTEATETLIRLMTQALVLLLVNSRLSRRLANDEHIRSLVINRGSNKTVVDSLKKLANMIKVQARDKTKGTAIKATREDIKIMASSNSSNRSITTFMGEEELQHRTNRGRQ